MTESEKPARKALVFEQDITLAEMIEDTLHEEGYSTISALHHFNDPEEFVARVKPDLVLLDAVLAGLNGWEVAQNLLRAHPKLKILMLTVRPLEVVKTLRYQTGVTDFIRKPFTKADLAAKLRDSFHSAAVLIGGSGACLFAAG